MLVSDNPQPFQDLLHLFKKDFFSVYESPFKEQEKKTEELKQYDFILLHLDYDTKENAKRIAYLKSHSVCPLYVFSKGHQPEEISMLLEQGSEGHIEIPFHARTVASRIKAVLRFLHQIKRTAPNILRYGRLIVKLDNREVLMDNKNIPLTNVEFKIFQVLLEHGETVVSKDKIIHAVWDQDVSATDNALGIHITRLRKKLKCDNDEDLIETVWGLGYRLNLELCELREQN